MDALPFKKPEKKARLARPTVPDRLAMANDVANFAIDIESDETVVGFAVVLLQDTGKTKTHWNSTRGGEVRLEGATRGLAAKIAEVSRKEW